MSTAISSARYTDLYDYTRTAEQIDNDLIGQADKLAVRLATFEATCRESGFQVGSDSLGPAMRSYGVRALPIDQRVRKVGEGFERADALWRPAHPSRWLMPTWVDLDSMLPIITVAGLLEVAGWLVDKTVILSRVAEITDIVAKVGTSFFIRFGSKRPGRVGIFSPSWIKRAATLISPPKAAGRIGVRAPKLSRLAWNLSARSSNLSTVLNTMFGFRYALQHVGIISVLSIVPASVKQLKANAQQYALDPIGMVAANVIDLEFIAATSIIGAAGGAKIGSVAGGIIGGAIGSVIPVAGTAAGATVGAFIGGTIGGAVGGWGAGKLQDKFIESDIHDDIVDGISQKSNQAVDSLGEKYSELASYLKTKAHELVDYVDTTTDDLANYLNTKTNEFEDHLNIKAAELLNGDKPAVAF